MKREMQFLKGLFWQDAYYRHTVFLNSMQVYFMINILNCILHHMTWLW